MHSMKLVVFPSSFVGVSYINEHHHHHQITIAFLEVCDSGQLQYKGIMWQIKPRLMRTQMSEPVSVGISLCQNLISHTS